MNLPPTLCEKLDRIPPVVARIFAKGDDGKIASDPELCERTDWGLKKLRNIYNARTWADVTAQEIDTFLSACGLRWGSQRRLLALLRRYDFKLDRLAHLKVKSGPRAVIVVRLQRRIQRLYQDA